MKISIITVTYNAAAFLQECIDSIREQTHPDVELIVIDGNSTDGTLDIINSNRQKIDKFVSEPDKGIYDAMNKGIGLADGEIIGILNADDVFASDNALELVNTVFTDTGADAAYGNLWYIDRNNPRQVIRKWVSGAYRRSKIAFGWMPPHPTFYARKELFEKYGNYDTGFGTAADYELMTRFLFRFNLKARYIDEVLVHMRTGGASNITLASRLKASAKDYKAMKINGLKFPFLAILLKPLRKLSQYLALPG